MDPVYNGMPAAQLRGLAWTKSRRSGPNGGNCVEIAQLPTGKGVAVRNSRHPDGPALLTHAEIRALIQGVKDGDFDHLLERRTRPGPRHPPAGR